MPSFLVHSIIPLFPLLAVRRLDARKVWMLWPLAHIPDLDYFLGYHRATLTSLFILVPGFLLAFYGWRNEHRRSLLAWGLIANAYLASHIVMDTFTGGTVPLYPFSTWTACYYATIRVVTATNTPYLSWGDCSRPGIPQVTDVYTWLDYDESAMLAVLTLWGIVVGARALAAAARRGGVARRKRW